MTIDATGTDAESAQIGGLGGSTPEPGSVPGGGVQPGCGKGLAELPDRLGPGAVHPGEIGLGHRVSHAKVVHPGRSQHPPGGRVRLAGRAGAWRACCPVTR